MLRASKYIARRSQRSMEQAVRSIGFLQFPCGRFKVDLFMSGCAIFTYWLSCWDRVCSSGKCCWHDTCCVWSSNGFVLQRLTCSEPCFFLQQPECIHIGNVSFVHCLTYYIVKPSRETNEPWTFTKAKSHIIFLYCSNTHFRDWKIIFT